MIKKIFPFVFAVLSAFQFENCFGQARLQADDKSFPTDMTLNVGNVNEFVYKISNTGYPTTKIKDIYFKCYNDADISHFPSTAKYYLTYSDSAPTYYYNDSTYIYPHSRIPITNSYTLGITNHIDSTALASVTPHWYLGVGDYVYVHIPFRVISCGAPGGHNEFWADTGHGHIEYVDDTTIVKVNGFSPKLTAQIVTPLDSATWCRSVHKDTMTVRFRYTNTGLSSVPLDTGEARADSIRLYMFCNADMGHIDISTVKINGVSVSSVVSGYTSSGKNIYVVDLPNFSAGPHGVIFGNKNTLRDWSGCGSASSLAEGGSFDLTATFVYDTVNCPDFSACNPASTTYMLPYVVSFYNNMCMTKYIHALTLPYDTLSLYEPNAKYEYSYQAFASTLTPPTDVLDTTPFTVEICPSFSQFWAPQGFHFDCKKGYYQINVNLPTGYHLYTGTGSGWRDSTRHTTAQHSKAFSYDPLYITSGSCPQAIDTLNPITTDTNAPLFTEYYSTSTLSIDLGALRLNHCDNNENAADGLPCIDFPLIIDCSQITNAYSRSADSITFSLQYVCDSGCSSCANTLACGKGYTFRHCDGGCTSIVSTDHDFTFLRHTIGYKNQNIALADSFYTTCGINSIPLGLPDTVENKPVINLYAAYPGDDVEEKVTGGFSDTLKHMKDVFLQLNHSAISNSGSRDLFEMDTEIHSTFVMTGCSSVSISFLNNKTLIIPGYSVITTTGTEVQYSFSLFDAVKNSYPAYYTAFVNDAGHENISIAADIHLRAKTHPYYSGQFFLSGGPHPVPNLRTQFYAVGNSGDSAWSCDSWGGLFSLYQPSIGASFAIDTTPSSCAKIKILFRFNTEGALYTTSQDDFPSEFRPYSELDSVLSIILPKGYTYLSSEFSAYMDNYSTSGGNYFIPGSSAHTFSVTPQTTTYTDSTVVKFTGLDYVNNPCWPLVDSKYSGGDNKPGYYLTVFAQPDCNEPTTGKFKCRFKYKINTQQENDTFQVVVLPNHPSNDEINELHSNPISTFNPPSIIYDTTNTISFKFQICNYGTTAIEDQWFSIQDTGGFAFDLSSATLKNLTTTFTYTPTYYSSPSGDMFNVGRINPGTCDTFLLKINISDSSLSCPIPQGTGVIGYLKYFYGNVCTGTVSRPSNSCQDDSGRFTYKVYPANLSLTNNGYSPSPISLCGDTLVDSLTISSDDLGTISNPSFWASLPPGVSLYKVVYAYPCGETWDTILYTPDLYALNSYGIVTAFGWNLNSVLHINGLQGTLGDTSGSVAGGGTAISTKNKACVKVYMIMSCDYKDTAITFYTIGTTTCGHIDTASTSITPSVNSTCCNRCWSSRTYGTTLKNATASLLSYVSLDCTDVLIEGTFTVDRDFYFNGCHVFLAPNALINVVNNSWLYVEQGACEVSRPCSHLQAACDTMWRGIFIQPGSTLYTNDLTLIEDADTAVFAKNVAGSEGIYHLLLSTFNKNYKDIVVQPVVGNAYAGTSVDCRYTCRNFDSIFASSSGTCIDEWNWHYAPFDVLKEPHAGEKTLTGWQIDSVHMFVDSAGLSPFFESGLNVFDNLHNGILSYGSNLVICSDTFQYINTGHFNHAAILAFGNSSDLSTLKIGGTGTLRRPNIFYNCTTGIHDSGDFQNIQILDNKMYMDNTHGGSYGIINMGPMPGCTTTIDSNTIDSATIGIVCLLNQWTNTLIDSNVIKGDNYCNTGVGVMLDELGSKWATYNVENNTMGNLQVGVYGVNLYHATIYRDTIYLNDTICSNPAVGIATLNDIGDHIVSNTITMNSHPSASYYAGKDFRGILVENSNFCYMVCNNINYVDTAITCSGAADLGFSVWSNVMTAGPDTLSNGIELTNGAKLGTQEIISGGPSNNQWIDSFNCRSYVDPYTLPSKSTFNYDGSSLSFYPIGGACNPLSINSTSGYIYNCTNHPPTIHHDLLDSIADTKTYYSEYAYTSMTIAKQSLTTIIWANDSLLSSDSILHAFNDSINLTSLGEIMSADTMMANENSALVGTAQWYYMNSLSPASNIEANLQTVGSICLNLRATGVTTLTPGQLSALTTLANKCPYTDGIGVYQARAMLAYYNRDLTVYFDENCSSHGGHGRIKEKKTPAKTDNISFNLYPNPNNGNFTISYDLGNETAGKVELYNEVGMKVAEYLLSSSTGTMEINNPNLSQDIYIYKVYKGSEVKKVGKVIIIK